MRGRRLAELAAGDFLAEVRIALNEAAAELALQLPPPPHLAGSDRRIILIEFEGGRNHLIYYFMAKLLPMGDPPTCISIISHLDPSIALRYADKALESDSQHPRVGKLREEPLRSQYAAWKNNPAVLNSNLDPNSFKELRQRGGPRRALAGRSLYTIVAGIGVTASSGGSTSLA